MFRRKFIDRLRQKYQTGGINLAKQLGTQAVKTGVTTGLGRMSPAYFGATTLGGSLLSGAGTAYGLYKAHDQLLDAVGPEVYGHMSAGITGAHKDPNINKQLKKYGDAFYGRKMQLGGIQDLPGGVAEPIPGSDAIEFSGATHDEGGIMMDPQTEVEDGETMDQVTMAKHGGKKHDYFFSSYLKKGGQSFADMHKNILAEGGDQNKINTLARMQEVAANRNPNTIAKRGGFTKYQTGGPAAEYIPQRDFVGPINVDEAEKDRRKFSEERKDIYLEGKEESLQKLRDEDERRYKEYQKETEIEKANRKDIVYKRLKDSGVPDVDRYIQDWYDGDWENIDPEFIQETMSATDKARYEQLMKNKDKYLKYGFFGGDPNYEETRKEAEKKHKESGWGVHGPLQTREGLLESDIIKLADSDKYFVEDLKFLKDYESGQNPISYDDWVKRLDVHADRSILDSFPDMSETVFKQEHKDLKRMQDQRTKYIDAGINTDNIDKSIKNKLEEIKRKSTQTYKKGGFNYQLGGTPIDLNLSDNLTGNLWMSNLPQIQSPVQQPELINLSSDNLSPSRSELPTEEEILESNRNLIADPTDPAVIAANKKADKEFEAYLANKNLREQMWAHVNKRRKTPTAALAAGAAQAIPALYSFLHKQPPAEQSGFTPGFTTPIKADSIKAQQLERANYNNMRSQLSAAIRGGKKFIETSGGGPADMANMQSLLSKEIMGNMQITAAETKANTAIKNAEAQLAQQAAIDNAKRQQQAAVTNAQLSRAEAARLDQIDVLNAAARQKVKDDQEFMKYQGLAALAAGAAGLTGDVLDYRGQERYAKAIGSEGIYERDVMRNYLAREANRTGIPDVCEAGDCTKEQINKYITDTYNLKS